MQGFHPCTKSGRLSTKVEFVYYFLYLFITTGKFVYPFSYPWDIGVCSYFPLTPYVLGERCGTFGELRTAHWFSRNRRKVGFKTLTVDAE